MRTVLFAAAFLALFSSGSRADDMVGPPLWKGAGIPGQKVGIFTAADAAVKARPGRIIYEEVRQQAGGSGLRWAFVVCSRGQQYRVGIDAKSGRLLENVAHGSKTC